MNKSLGQQFGIHKNDPNGSTIGDDDTFDDDHYGIDDSDLSL